ESAYIINLDNPVVRNYPLTVIKQTTGLTTNINAIYRDTDGDLWFSQNRRGLGIYSPQNETVRHYKEFPSLAGLSGLVNLVFIGSVSADPDGVWLAPEYARRIYVVKKNRDRSLSLLKEYNLDAVKAGNPVSIYDDKRGNIWIATTAGLVLKPASSDSLQNISVGIHNMSDITADDKGDIWISTTTNGVYCFTPHCDANGQWSASELKHLHKENSQLPSNDIETICSDTVEKRIWMGSKEGDVIICYTDGLHIRNATKNSKGIINEGILHLVTDSIGHIWVGTNKCIIEYNPRNKGKMIYNAGKDVIVNSFARNACWYGGDDFIFFGGNRGIVQVFNNPSVNENAGVVRTFVTDVKINGVSILTGSLPDEDYTLDADRFTLTLGADAHNIEFDISARNYSYPDKVLYAYRIKGIDEDWVYTNGERQFAYYNSLPKGKHTLELKATDENGLWSGRIVRYTILKKPAFYETWWAYTLYICIFIGVLYLVYRWVKMRMELRSELRIAQIEKEKSEELTQAKLRYFTNVSHDFLTPITIVSCLIDDVEITYHNHIPQLERMRSNLGRLKRLIQQVLDFRKIENGKMELKISLGDLSSFLYELCSANFEPLMGKKQILFEFNNSELQLPAYFDADKLEKIVFNLLSNAYKYTEEGGKVTLALSQKQEDGHTYATIVVSDTGQGIPKEHLANIFDRFFTLKENESMAESNGIGLSLVKELLDLHHATIAVQSEVGVGTKFTIVLPIDKDSYAPDELVSAEQMAGMKRLELEAVNVEPQEGKLIAESNEFTSPTDNRCMLIVEDNEELLDLMFHIFSRHRQVLIAHNGIEALAVLEKTEVDIIISDVMMPEMDGLELCRHLKADIKVSHIPVILLTARSSADDRVECYKAGADGYIAKPFELKVLEARVESFLVQKRVRQEEFQAAEKAEPEKLELSNIDRNFMDKVVAYINDNLDNSELDVNELADNLCMSKSTLYRKIKSVTNLSPVELIRNLRLKHAHKLLKEGGSIMDTAFACGFSNPKYFSTCFKEQFGISPKDFQKQA
ncbi:MAG: response regulator, partial [Bacteroides sp.]|nr:response regulator [Bacteroides sp.]